ncbi:MAG: hypothetical protein IT378_16230 [Sandaracinaceae bacterium]|nr:hypothetical protein [Sandaracinaceae bacterium]
MPALAALLARHLPAGAVALVGAERWREALADREVVSAPDAAALAGTYCAIVSAAALDAPLTPLVEHLEPGGLLFVVLPTVHDGLRGAMSGLLARVRGSSPVELEDVCGALLVAGARDIRAEEVGGALGSTAVWGRFDRGSE